MLCRRHAVAQKGVPINAVEREALKNGNLGAYYQSRFDRGDQYGAVGLSFWDPSNPNASHSGLAAFSSGRLLYGAIEGGYISPSATKAQMDSAIYNIGLDLAHRYAAAVTQDYLDNVGSVRGILSIDQVTDFHHDSFRSFNISPIYYGGTPVMGLDAEAYIFMPMFGLSKGFD
jgi:hypothetical protein